MQIQPAAADDEPWRQRHPMYGPCDGFGPDGECSECTGVIQRSDGSRVDLLGALVFSDEMTRPRSVALLLNAVAARKRVAFMPDEADEIAGYIAILEARPSTETKGAGE